MPPSPSQRQLTELQRRAFDYFPNHCNPENGLIADSTLSGTPCSIAATGFALSCYPIAVENGWMTKREALKLTRAAAHFFLESEQSTAPDATGYRGFYFHFLDMKTGRRAWKCELSTIDTVLLLYGFLTASTYFGDSSLNELTEALVTRLDWQWATSDSQRVALAWKPELINRTDGFQRARWGGYNEGLLLQILALGAPHRPLGKGHYDAWCATYTWKTIYGIDYLYAGPLFVHQFPHLWLDLRGLPDAYMRAKGSDYFQNTQRAIAVQREYCRRNPGGWKGYTEDCWGLTASDGPGSKHNKNGRKFWTYRARGVPFGPDDGTLSPWAIAASLPFAPEDCLRALEHLASAHPHMTNHFGLRCSFNPTVNWRAGEYFGLDQGPIVMAIENHRTGFVWDLMRDHPILQKGLKRAEFSLR